MVNVVIYTIVNANLPVQARFIIFTGRNNDTARFQQNGETWSSIDDTSVGARY